MQGLPFGSIDWFLYEDNTAIHKIKLDRILAFAQEWYLIHK